MFYTAPCTGFDTEFCRTKQHTCWTSVLADQLRGNPGICETRRERFIDWSYAERRILSVEKEFFVGRILSVVY